MSGTLAGRTALVTGGNRGLGRAMAVAMADAGADIVIWGRDTGALESTAAEVRATGRDCLAQVVDVTDSAQVNAAADEAWQQAGGVDAAFTSAGVLLLQPATETTDADWAAVMDANLTGLFYCCRAFGERMLAHDGGKIINIASNFGLHGGASWSAYSASKAGVIGLSKSLAWEWAPSVTVNVISPGAFYTDMNSHLLDIPEIMAAIEGNTPLGRVGDPPELGPLAVMLAGPGSDFMTGAVISVDGGVIKP
ncbi:MAG: SDR family NAD(P)-dependent oxidoreductase [bacterium]|nr:SDR family NAD(P)-dependent oxidoreductase [bacterium]